MNSLRGPSGSCWTLHYQLLTSTSTRRAIRRPPHRPETSHTTTTYQADTTPASPPPVSYLHCPSAGRLRKKLLIIQHRKGHQKALDDFSRRCSGLALLHFSTRCVFFGFPQFGVTRIPFLLVTSLVRGLTCRHVCQRGNIGLTSPFLPRAWFGVDRQISASGKGDQKAAAAAAGRRAERRQT